MLGPAAHRRELHKPVARPGDSFERLLQTVSVIGIGMAAKPVLVCHYRPRLGHDGWTCGRRPRRAVIPYPDAGVNGEEASASPTMSGS